MIVEKTTMILVLGAKKRCMWHHVSRMCFETKKTGGRLAQEKES